MPEIFLFLLRRFGAPHPVASRGLFLGIRSPIERQVRAWRATQIPIRPAVRQSAVNTNTNAIPIEAQT